MCVVAEVGQMILAFVAGRAEPKTAPFAHHSAFQIMRMANHSASVAPIFEPLSTVRRLGLTEVAVHFVIKPAMISFENAVEYGRWWSQ